MKMYSVSVTWHPYRAKKWMINRAVILANSAEEAVTIFKNNVHLRNGAKNGILSVTEITDGIFTLGEHQIR